MQAYEGFASIYDIFMGDIDYDTWVEYIKKIWEKYGKNPKLIAELGCGTGNITGRLAQKGYDMIGIDISEEMLSIARQKALDENSDILYLCQDMAEFELYGTVDIVISLCDSMNYITDEKDMLKVFKLVNNYLEPKGLFIFDLNTQYKFKNMLSSNTYAETTENAAYIWENYYDEEEKINEYYVNFFIKQKGDIYERVEECHYERAYSLDEIKTFISKSGMEFVTAYDAFTFEKPKAESERIYVIACEKGK